MLQNQTFLPLDYRKKRVNILIILELPISYSVIFAPVASTMDWRVLVLFSHDNILVVQTI
jgi:hypothetical protein